MIPMLAVALMLAAPPKSSKPSKPAPIAASADAGVAGPILASPLEQAGEVKEIELDEKRARAVYRIRTAISIPAVIEFPEAFSARPSCGSCASPTSSPDNNALFALRAEEKENYLVISPRLAPGPQLDGTTLLVGDYITTVTVRLASLTLTLQVELTEDKKLADPRVRFTLPGRGAESKFVTESIAKAKSALEADFAARVEAAASEQLLRSFLEPHECRSASNRQRTDDMVLELKELCRFGRRLFVRFALENRGRSLFVLGELAAGVGDGKSFTALEARSLTTLPEVAFQQSTEGVVSFDVEDPSAHSFELRLTEKGGRTRSIALQGFGF